MATSEEQHRRSTGSTSTDKHMEDLDSRQAIQLCSLAAISIVGSVFMSGLQNTKPGESNAPSAKIIPVYGKGRVDSYEKSRPAAPTRCRNRTEKKETTTVDDNWINVLKVGAVIGGLVGAYFMGKHTGKKYYIRTVVPMIILDKCLESILDRYMREYCEKQKSCEVGGSAGFLIGSKVDENFHVAHIALCPYPNTVQDKGDDSRSKSIDPNWISDAGSRVLRFLPGGITIVGLLWLSDSAKSLKSSEIRVMLIQALAQISVHHNALSSLSMKIVDKNMALIGIETRLEKPFGCIVDCSRKSADGSQTRVCFGQLDWISLKSSVSFRLSVPLIDGMWDFHNQFINAIRNWVDCLLKTNVALVDGVQLAQNEPLKPRDKKRERSAFLIELFINTEKKPDLDNENLSAFCVMDLMVDILVKAALPSKANVGQAIDAVKEHIIRSLCSRAELHYESTDVIEDEPKDLMAVHQLPRAAYASLSTQEAIFFTDYLFESDTAADAQRSFAEFLTLDIPE
ncbi:unnamed protein product, partial [Thelazia callipaeda]|uniref:ANK_REP_REGION domain-containing protein n=1 Tax=Thelazia callipaeda TaxID=103827 RepID=A0A0N5CRD3_THECL